MAAQRKLLLASSSPRRRDILATLGLTFDVEPVDADERALSGELAEDYLTRIAAEKLRLALPVARRHGCDAVLVADTTVVLDGRMLAKPLDAADNRVMIRALAGRAHQVMTRFSVAMIDGPERARTVVTDVIFRALSDDEIDRYVASGEGRDKAGGYAIQGLGGFAVATISGSYTNVVGLPACEVIEALCEIGALDAFPLSTP